MIAGNIYTCILSLIHTAILNRQHVIPSFSWRIHTITAEYTYAVAIIAVCLADPTFVSDT
jgi:hypothetical protein